MTKQMQRRFRAMVGKLAKEAYYYEDRKELKELHYHLRFYTLKDLNIRTAYDPKTTRGITAWANYLTKPKDRPLS